MAERSWAELFAESLDKAVAEIPEWQRTVLDELEAAQADHPNVKILLMMPPQWGSWPLTPGSDPDGV